ncbi:hypothetical protein TRAPUB_9374, partial [Trametes pubescens]
MDPHTSMHESDLDPSSASVSPTTPGVYSQGEVVADEDNGQDWSDWDDDGSDEEYRAGTERGMAQLKLEHTSLSTTLPRVNSQNEFILHIEGLREGGGEVIVRVIALPSTVEDARAMNVREWDICLSDIRDVFGDLLRRSQMDAISTMATVYLWFAQTSAAQSDEGRDIPSVWRELQELLMNAAVMGVCLNTPGEVLIRNVEGWARSNIA